MEGSNDDFFYQEVSTKLLRLQKKGTTLTHFLTQSEINRIDNLTSYQFHRDDTEIKDRINELQSKACQYTDMTKTASYNSFADNYLSKVFELAIFDLLKNTHKFELVVREPMPPDLIFLHDVQAHQVECVTCTSSLMDKFFESRPKFNQYIKVAEIIIAVNKDSHHRNNYGFDNALSTPAISMLFHELTKDEIEKIENLIQVHTLLAAKNNFLFWVYLMRYARLFFVELLSEEVLTNLSNISLPSGLCGDASHDEATMNHILKSLGRAIIEKVNKFSQDSDKPLTLAVSFSLCRDFLSIPNPIDLINFVCENLRKFITAERTLSEEKFVNLYAVIIDTSWYNWFSDIAVKRHHAQFPQSFNNCYGCIYNSENSLVKQGKFIYGRIPFVGNF